MNVVPLPDGVPLITPAADRLSPAGKDPLANDHVFEPVPPVAVNVCEYGTPGAPVGIGVAVVIVSTALMLIVSDFVAVCTPSVTCAVNVVPLPDGVPLITPGADRLSPVGKDPLASDHVFEPVPPVAVNVCEYGTPGAPVGIGVAVVIVSTALMLRVSDFVTV